MAIEYGRKFAPTQLTTSLVTLFTLGTLGDGRTMENMVVRFTNTTAGAVTVDAHLVPSSGSASDTNKVVPTVSIAANSTSDIRIPKMIGGDFLQAKASAGASISMSEVTGKVRL